MSDRAHRQIASAGPPAPDHHGHVAAHVERRVHRELCTACCDRAVKVVCYALCTFYFIFLPCDGAAHVACRVLRVGVGVHDACGLG